MTAAVANQLVPIACVNDHDGFEIDRLAAALTCRLLLGGHARVIGTQALALQPCASDHRYVRLPCVDSSCMRTQSL